MKKSKILIPVLSITGLGCAITPMIAMTSCGNPKATEIEATWDTSASGYVYYHEAGIISKGKYKLTINNFDSASHTAFEIGKIYALDNDQQPDAKFFDENTLEKITVDTDTLVRDEDYTVGVWDGFIEFTAKGKPKTKSKKIVVEFEVNEVKDQKTRMLKASAS